MAKTEGVSKQGRRAIDPTVRADVTAKALAGEPLKALAEQYGLSYQTVLKWRNEAAHVEPSSGPRTRPTQGDWKQQTRITILEIENQHLRETKGMTDEVAILKAEIAFLKKVISVVGQGVVEV